MSLTYEEQYTTMEFRLYDDYLKAKSSTPSPDVRGMLFLAIRESYFFKKAVQLQVEADAAYALATERANKLEHLLDHLHTTSGKTKELGLDESIKQVINYVDSLRSAFIAVVLERNLLKELTRTAREHLSKYVRHLRATNDPDTLTVTNLIADMVEKL